MVISHNLLAMNAQRQFNITGTNKKKSTEKLASGYKINRAADDAAGLAISEKMRRQIRGLNQGARNTQDGISLLQVADGALNEVHDMLHRMSELSIQAANGTNTDSDREAIQQEISQIKSEIDRISDTTEFNTRKLFKDDGSGSAGSYSYIIGYNEETKTITHDIDKTVQFSCSVSGNPTESTATTYTASIGTNGLNINSSANAVSWANIKDGSGNSINLDNVSAGNYHFDYKGIRVDFSVSEEITGDELKTGLDGLSWSTKKVDGEVISYEIYGSLDDFYLSANSWLDLHIMENKEESSWGIKISGVAYNSYFSIHDFFRYEDIKNSDGKSLTDDELIPGEYTCKASKSSITVIIGQNNTASFSDIRDTIYGRFWTLDNSGSQGKNFDNPTELLYSKDEENGDSVVADKINNIPSFTIHRTVTEEVTERTPIYNSMDPPVTDGTAKNLWIQSGAEVGDGMFITLSYMDTNILGINGVDVSTEAGASNAIDLIGNAVDKISSMRSSFGAQQNRLEHTYKNVTNTAENTQAAESRIRDTDMAKEMVELSKHKILEQAGTTMITQANQTNQGVLNLLQ